MSSLQRYKKAGGFHQLVSLIETFGLQKQEKFLEMIEAENSGWAYALRDKMISLERILSWPDQVVVEIFKTLPPATMDHVLLSLPEEQRKRVTQFLTYGDRRRIEDAADLNPLKPEELASVVAKLVEAARRMVSTRTLHPDRFDPLLTIPDDFETQLEQQGYRPKSKKSPSPSTVIAASIPVAQPDPGDESVEGLKVTVQNLLNENRALRDENRLLRDKLDQIRKIA